MILITMKRIHTGDEGTSGIMYAPNFTCCTLELPWKDNKDNVSCITNGLYNVTPYKSHTFGDCFHIDEVYSRENILIHPLNFAGDKSKGKRSESEGCIGVGMYHDIMRGQLAVMKSRVAMDKLTKFIGGEEFLLSIENIFELEDNHV